MKMLLALIASSALAAETWHPFGPGGGGWIEDVVAHPTNPKEVWAMTDLSGLFRSQDAGLTWRKMSADVERGVVARKQITSHNRQFAIDPVDSKHMYWGVCGMIWASHDGGVTWHDFHHDAPSYTARGFTYGGTPGRVIYHMFGNMARTTHLHE